MEQIDLLADLAFSLGSCSIPAVMHEFSLQRAEEALWRGVPAETLGKVPSLAHLTQLAKVFGAIDRRRDAAAMLNPARVLNSTACWQNSAV